MKFTTHTIGRHAIEVWVPPTLSPTTPILVMHDGPENRQATVDALPALIERLRGEGYEPVSVTELLGRDFIRAPR